MGYHCGQDSVRLVNLFNTFTPYVLRENVTVYVNLFTVH